MTNTMQNEMNETQFAADLALLKGTIGQRDAAIIGAALALATVAGNGYERVQDCLSNDTRESCAVLSAALRVARGAIDGIEEIAREVLVEEKAFAARRVNELDGLTL